MNERVSERPNVTMEMRGLGPWRRCQMNFPDVFLCGLGEEKKRPECSFQGVSHLEKSVWAKWRILMMSDSSGLLKCILVSVVVFLKNLF